MPTYQKTIAKAIVFKGIGIHKGSQSIVKIYPASENHGIIFEKILVNGQKITIKSSYQKVDSTLMATNLAQGNCQIHTIEHLLSALYALGIDNALIQIEGEEIPIMDGSSAPFVYGLKKIGIVEQKENKKYLKVLKNIKVQSNGAYARLNQFDGFRLSFEIDYDHPLFKNRPNQYSIDLSKNTADYENVVAKARTYGFLKDLTWLKENNLAKGASLDNSLHIHENSINPKQTLRDEAEFVQHKILDAIGDLSLIGYNLLASYHGYRAGHKLNHQLICQLFADDSNYKIIN